jgi:hypothetical protein
MVLPLKRVLLLGVMLACLGSGCGNAGRLGAKALSEQAISLQSQAAEGALLAQDVLSEKTTRIYTRGHSADLYKAASQVEASLRSARTEPRLEGTLRRLVAVATRVSAELKRLRDASQDEARVLGRELRAAASQSQKIGSELK